MKKMMKKSWLMLGVLAILVSPLFTSCSDDDDNDNGGRNEPELPYVKVNGGNVNFAIDQYEATIASIESNNEVKLSKKPSWIENVVISKNADGTYAAVITRNQQNDTELRSDSIVFTASTASAKVVVTCTGQKLDATYTIDKLEKPADGFFGEKGFTFSVLRAASSSQDTVLVFMPGMRGALFPVQPDRLTISKAKAATAEAINTTSYTVKVSDLNDRWGDVLSTFYFFVMSETDVENFNPNLAPDPDFVLKQCNSAFPMISMVDENYLEITPGTAQEITVLYNNKLIAEIAGSAVAGFPDYWAEDPMADVTLVSEITLTQKSSTVNGDYTTVVYTVNAQQCDGGRIIFLGKDTAGEYVRNEEDQSCYSIEIECAIISE